MSELKTYIDPCTDYIVNTSRPLDIKTDPIESEEAK